MKPLAVSAAGSLRAAFTALAGTFEHERGVPVALSCGASGLLRQRLMAGDHAEVFASADLGHPRALAEAGRAGPVSVFASNTLCLLAAPGFSLQGQPLVQRLLDADVKLGTSTPGADPSGDYAWALFDRCGGTEAAALKAKALCLTGAADAPRERVEGGSVYGALVAAGRADVFVTYRSNALQAQRERPQLQVLPLPPALHVPVHFGVCTVGPVRDDAIAFIALLRGAQGQALLADYGFGAA